MSKMKRQTPFKSVHVKEYGLVIVECTPQSPEVESVSSPFCVNFGREEKPGAKCKATANVMYFKKPFKTDSYKRHVEDQHPEHWKQYQSTSYAFKKTYFQDRAPAVSIKNRITAHLPGIQIPIHHTVRMGIVDIIIGEMCFEPNEEDDNNLVDTVRRKPYQFSRKVKKFQACVIL